MSCGDQPPVRVTAAGELEVLGGGALPRLGSDGFPGGRIAVQSCRLAPGERLLLLSDGILERRGRDGESLGLAGVAAATAAASDASAPATLRAIEDAVREISPEVLEDDATLVVLAATGKARRN